MGQLHQSYGTLTPLIRLSTNDPGNSFLVFVVLMNFSMMVIEIFTKFKLIRDEQCVTLYLQVHCLILYNFCYLSENSGVSFYSLLTTRSFNGSSGASVISEASIIGTGVSSAISSLNSFKSRARTIFISICANLIPMQLRGPCPNGR